MSKFFSIGTIVEGAEVIDFNVLGVGFLQVRLALC